MGAAALESTARAQAAEPGGVVVWLSGQDVSSKSVLAEALRREFVRRGYLCAALDGDVVERAIVPPHGDAPDGRRALHQTIARLAAMLCDQGQVVVVAAPDNDAIHREEARGLAERFLEVLVESPPDQPASQRTLRLPGFDREVERTLRPDVIAREPVEGAVLNRIVHLVARRAS